MQARAVTGIVVGILVSLAACKNDHEPPPPAGPVYLPTKAYALHGVAPDCTLVRTGTSQRRDCTGHPGKVTIELGAGDHFSHLTIALKPMYLMEAKARLDQPLFEILGASERDQILAALDKLQVGDQATLVLGKAKVTVMAMGPSRIAPKYTVDIGW